MFGVQNTTRETATVLDVTPAGSEARQEANRRNEGRRNEAVDGGDDGGDDEAGAVQKRLSKISRTAHKEPEISAVIRQSVVTSEPHRQPSTSRRSPSTIKITAFW